MQCFSFQYDKQLYLFTRVFALICCIVLGWNTALGSANDLDEYKQILLDRQSNSQGARQQALDDYQKRAPDFWLATSEQKFKAEVSFYLDLIAHESGEQAVAPLQFEEVWTYDYYHDSSVIIIPSQPFYIFELRETSQGYLQDVFQRLDAIRKLPRANAHRALIESLAGEVTLRIAEYANDRAEEFILEIRAKEQQDSAVYASSTQALATLYRKRCMSGDLELSAAYHEFEAEFWRLFETANDNGPTRDLNLDTLFTLGPCLQERWPILFEQLIVDPRYHLELRIQVVRAMQEDGMDDREFAFLIERLSSLPERVHETNGLELDEVIEEVSLAGKIIYFVAVDTTFKIADPEYDHCPRVVRFMHVLMTLMSQILAEHAKIYYSIHNAVKEILAAYLACQNATQAQCSLVNGSWQSVSDGSQVVDCTLRPPGPEPVDEFLRLMEGFDIN